MKQNGKRGLPPNENDLMTSPEIWLPSAQRLPIAKRPHEWKQYN